VSVTVLIELAQSCPAANPTAHLLWQGAIRRRRRPNRWTGSYCASIGALDRHSSGYRGSSEPQ
jgi:hypothetical protein